MNSKEIIIKALKELQELRIKYNVNDTVFNLMKNQMFINNNIKQLIELEKSNTVLKNMCLDIIKERINKDNLNKEQFNKATEAIYNRTIQENI